MTVKELKEALAQCDDEAIVIMQERHRAVLDHVFPEFFIEINVVRYQNEDTFVILKPRSGARVSLAALEQGWRPRA